MEIRHEYYETIDSTNSELRRRYMAGQVEEGLVISAAEQTAGRGRSGHEWKSPVKVSIATSMMLEPKMHIENVPRLTLIAAMAVASAIEETIGVKTEIKWPNDIIVNKKKVCGILTEMMAEKNQVGCVIVGIGVNIHNRQYPEEIADKAISLDQAIEAAEVDSSLWIDPAADHPKQASRKATDYAIWEHFAKYYELFAKTEDLSGILTIYNERLVNKDNKVRVLDPLGEYEGIARGMDATGALLVEVDGQVKAVDSGEVSVRGIYGYV